MVSPLPMVRPRAKAVTRTGSRKNTMAGNSGVPKVARVALPMGRRLLYILMTALAVTFVESTKMNMALAQ